MGGAARKSVKAFCPGAAMSTWERLFEETIDR